MGVFDIFRGNSGKRMYIIMRSVTVIVSLFAGAFTLAINAHRFIDEFSGGVSDSGPKKLDWQYNYKAYETTVVERTRSYIVIITQFIPKNKCVKQASVGDATQKLLNGAKYRRVLSDGGEITKDYPSPEKSEEWVTLSPYKLITSGMKPYLPFELQFTSRLDCDGVPVEINFPVLHVKPIQPLRNNR